MDKLLLDKFEIILRKEMKNARIGSNYNGFCGGILLESSNHV